MLTGDALTVTEGAGYGYIEVSATMPPDAICGPGKDCEIDLSVDVADDAPYMCPNTQDAIQQALIGWTSDPASQPCGLRITAANWLVIINYIQRGSECSIIINDLHFEAIMKSGYVP